MSVPFLDVVPAFRATHPNAVLYVEWAPTADLTADFSTWTFEDITSFVSQEQGRTINISGIGRTNWSASTSPAELDLLLKNSTGKFSRGPQSPTYPNLHLNIPIRVSISLTGLSADKKTRFYGYIYSLTPSWDSTGNYAAVQLKAAGITRRLQHKEPVLISPMKRAIVADPDVVAYWPMEDKEGTDRLSSGLERGKPMEYTGLNLANYSAIPGSDSVATFTSSGAISAPVVKNFSNNWQVDLYLNIPSSPAADVAVLRIHTSKSDIVRWELVIPSGSTNQIRLNGYDNTRTIVETDTLNTSIDVVGSGPINVRFTAQNSGANISYKLIKFDAAITSGNVLSGSYAGSAVGNVTQLSVLASANMAGISMGQVAVYNTFDHAQDDGPPTGYYGQTPLDRQFTIATQNNIPFVYLGGGVYPDTMGVQPVDYAINLLKDAERTDQGILLDGISPGIYSIARNIFQNRTAQLTFDLSQGQVQPPFQPEDDDQNIVNKVTVSLRGGSSATYEQVDGPLGTGTIREYETSVSNLSHTLETQVQHYASWFVHQGTIEGYRYPRLTVDLRKVPSQALNWLNSRPGYRIDLTNVSTYIPQHPPGDIQLTMIGWSERISRMVWDTDINCIPYEQWRVVELADPTGDTSEGLGRLDADSSTLNTTASAGATSLSVATAAGSALWTTTADDFPLTASVGGWPITVTNITGTSSPQTFTVSAIPAAISAGSEVKVWQPPALAL